MKVKRVKKNILFGKKRIEFMESKHGQQTSKKSTESCMNPHDAPHIRSSHTQTRYGQHEYHKSKTQIAHTFVTNESAKHGKTAGNSIIGKVDQIRFPEFQPHHDVPEGLNE
jgi:hypothetical protein